MASNITSHDLNEYGSSDFSDFYSKIKETQSPQLANKLADLILNERFHGDFDLLLAKARNDPKLDDIKIVRLIGKVYSETYREIGYKTESLSESLSGVEFLAFIMYEIANHGTMSNCNQSKQAEDVKDAILCGSNSLVIQEALKFYQSQNCYYF